jgi:DNA-binding SARP family transcriptional activator
MQAPSAPATLDLAGAVRLLWPGRPPQTLERRAAAIALRLALDGPQLRAALAAWLWPELPPARQRANLRQRLLALRQAAGGPAWIEGEELLALAPGLAVLYGSPGPEAPGVDRLLLAWSADEDLPVAHWAQERLQARVQQQALALEQALQAAESAPDPTQALVHAQALVALQPASERHHRTLMRLHYQAGDAAAALAVYEALHHLLAERFGSRPSADTEALLRLVLSSQRAPAPPRAVSASLWAALRRPPQCVGREAEARQLAEAMAARQAVLVLGEAGLGKSRLVGDVLDDLVPDVGPDAPAAGLVLSVRAQAGDAGVPYATCARLLQRLLQLRPTSLPPPLAHLLPDQRPLPAAASAPPAPASPAPARAPAVQPLALQQAVQGLLQQHPLAVVAVDDLHFADEASLEMLTVLAATGPETLADAPAWVLTQRPGEDPPAAARLRDKLVEAGRLQLLHLQPLTAAQTCTLVHSLRLPGVDAEALAPRLHAHTGGNPLYVLTTLQAALQSSAPEAALLAAALPRPGTLQALLDRRLRSLPERALALARIAALAGPDFSVELAEAVSGQRAIELADAWRALAEAQVLSEQGSFAHDLVLDAVLRGVPGPIARRLHGQVAAFLAQRSAAPARLAHHWEAAGHDAEAAQAMTAAAVAAGATGRYREEAEFHARAAAAWARCAREQERFAALCDRVDALVRADFGDESLAAAAALEAQAADDGQRLRAIRHHVDMLGNRGQAQQAVDRAAQAAPVLARLADSPATQAERIRLASAVAGCQALMMQGGQARATLDALLGSLRFTPELPEQQLLANLRANVAWVNGCVREAVGHFQQGAELARTLGQASNVATNLNNVATCWTRLGHTENAAQAAEGSYRLRLAADHGPGLMQQSAVNLARARRDQGRYAEALQLYEDARAAFEASGTALWRHVAELGLATVWMRLGQYARALPLLQTPDESAPPHLRGQRRLARAELALDLGSTPQPWLDEGWALLRNSPAHAGGGAITWLRALPPERAAAEAARWAAEALAADQGGVALAARVRQAQAALALGQAGPAEAAAQAALALLGQGLHPDGMGVPSVWLVAAEAALAAGARHEATQRAAAGAVWLRQTALPHVGASFVESFLQRQPAHRRLLALHETLAAPPVG